MEHWGFPQQACTRSDGRHFCSKSFKTCFGTMHSKYHKPDRYSNKPCFENVDIFQIRYDRCWPDVDNIKNLYFCILNGPEWDFLWLWPTGVAVFLGTPWYSYVRDWWHFQILQTTFSKWFFVNENRHVLIQISLKYVPSGATDNKPAMIQIMTWAPSQYKDRLIYVWRFPC